MSLKVESSRMALVAAGLSLSFAALGCAGDIEGTSAEPAAAAPDGRPRLGPAERSAGTGGSSSPANVAGAVAGAPAACPAGTAVSVEPSVVRLLNRREYGRTVRDLFRTTALPAAFTAAFNRIPPESLEEFGFDNGAAFVMADDNLVELQLEASETLAAGANLSQLVKCASSPPSSPACAMELIQSFGRRAFRRPLTPDETKLLQNVFSDTRVPNDTFDRAIRRVIEAILGSPQFLYRTETSASARGGVARVDPYELASRLSYFLWGSMPDDALLDAAGTGRLATIQDVEEHARRMLMDAKARETVAAFHDMWLELHKLMSEETDKDLMLFPAFPALRPLFRQETQRFVDHVFWGASGRLRDLLLNDTALLNDKLAAFYGVPGATGAALQPLSVAGQPRYGLLTQGSILAQYSFPGRNSPTLRGIYVRAQLLCQAPPEAPPDVPELPDIPNATLRERLAAHKLNPCASCHVLTDDVGFGFESYDAIGKYRTTEAGKPIDASGELVQIANGAGKFVGVRELSEKLVGTPELRECMATHWFRFAMGRNPGPKDQCALGNVKNQFAASGDRLRDLLIAIVRSDAFSHIQTEVTP